MHMKLSNIYNTRKIYDFKNCRSWQAWNVLYIFPFLLFFFSLNWGKNTYFFLENIWIHLWFYTFLWDDWELIDLQTSCSNSFSYLKRSTNKTEIKWNKMQYKNTKLNLGHKKKKKCYFETLQGPIWKKQTKKIK